MNVAGIYLSEKICTIIIVISAIIIFDMLFVGQTLASYAIDAIQTNGPNTEHLNKKTNRKLEKEIKEDKLLYQDFDSKLDVGVRTNNIATIINIHDLRKIAYIDSLPVIKNAKEDNLSRANVRKSISTGAKIRYISNIFSILSIIAVGLYFTEKKILKDNIRF